MRDKIHHLLFFPCLLILSLLSSCYENVAGCLDINATNFQVNADEECEDCCEYPKLYLKIAHKSIFDSLDNFFLNTPYPVAGNEDSLFIISGIKFYLSQIEFLRNDGTYVSVLDSTSLDYLEGTDTLSKFFKDDIVYVNRASDQTYTLGSFPHYGNFAGIRFRFGLSDEMNKVIPDNCPSGHPLAFQGDSSNWDNDTHLGYFINELNFKRDTASDTLTELSRLDNSYTFQITNGFNFEIPRGIDVTLTLRIDYLNWFENVDMRNQSIAEIQALIGFNMLNSIYVVDLD